MIFNKCFLFFVTPQHICVSDRNHRIQRQGQRVPRCQLRGGRSVCGLSLHPPGMDQHATKGTFSVIVIQ